VYIQTLRAAIIVTLNDECVCVCVCGQMPDAAADAAAAARHDDVAVVPLVSYFYHVNLFFFGYKRRDSLTNVPLYLGIYHGFDAVLANAARSFEYLCTLCTNRIVTLRAS